jgi:hypothetical protein
MKNNQLLCGLMLLGGIAFSSVAFAEHGHGGHGGFELSIGVPFYASPYYASPYYPYPYGYYPPPVVVMPAQPQVYIQQDNQPSAPQQSQAPQTSNYWFHCDKPEGYYPYIKECPAGWQKVAPTPPAAN